MDPASIIGVAAAAHQFLEKGYKLLKLLQSVHDNVKDLPRDIDSWRREIEDQLALFGQLDASPAIKRGGDGDGVGDTIESCREACSRLVDIFEDLASQADDSLARKTWKAVKGVDKEPEIRKRFDELQRHKATLIAKLSLVHIQQGQHVAEEVKQLVSEVRTIKQSVRPGSDESRCLQDLYLTDPANARDAIITANGKRVDGTCEWITSNPEYAHWRKSSPSGVLWICGGPGKGKTFLSIFLTQALAEEQADSSTYSTNSSEVIYFFCDNKDASRNNATAILRGLMYQLASKYPKLLQHLIVPWRTQQASLFGEHSFETLWKAFRAMVDELGTTGTDVYCILDGLDECNESSLVPLLRKIETLFDQDHVQTSLKLAVVSRKYPICLENKLGRFPHIDISGAHSSVERDIDAFITDRVRRLAATKHLDRLSPSLQAHIEATFREKSQGTFLWVSFMAKDLEAQQAGLAGMEAALKTLPRGLDEVYERILLQIGPKDRTIIAELLRWVTTAKRPLKVVELADALGLCDTEHLSRLQVCLGYIGLCGHLLHVYDLPPIMKLAGNDVQVISDFQPGENMAVTLVHQSAKDFLQLKNPKRRELADFMVSDDDENNLVVLQHLLRRMQSKWFPARFDTWRQGGSLIVYELVRGFSIAPNAEIEQNPLALYAYIFWTAHLCELSEVNLIKVVKEYKRFFKDPSTERTIWLYHRSEASVLHFACDHHLLPLAERLLRRRRRFSPFTFQRYIDQAKPTRVLLDAIDKGDADLVKLLLRFGARVAAPPVGHIEHDRSALEAAVVKDNVDIFDMVAQTPAGMRIIEHDISVAGSVQVGTSLLHRAAQYGLQRTCTHLLDKYRYPVDIAGPYGFTPLHHAIWFGQLELAVWLVERRKASTGSGYDILCALLSSGRHEEGWRHNFDTILSKWNIDINGRGDGGETILHNVFRTTSFPEHFILEFLSHCLGHGADPTICDEHGLIPLQRLAWFDGTLTANLGCVSLAVLLLRDGQVDKVSGTKSGDTLLHMIIDDLFITIGRGCAVEKADIFRGFTWLLDLGVDRYASNSGGNTPLELLKAKHDDVFYTRSYKYMTKGKGLNIETYKSRMLAEMTDVLENYATVSNDPARLDPFDWVYSRTEER